MRCFLFLSTRQTVYRPVINCLLFCFKELPYVGADNLSFVNCLYHFQQQPIPYVTYIQLLKKKVVIVNSRYWNRKELCGSSTTINILLLALTLQNIECTFTKIPRPYSNKLVKLRWRVITHYDYTQSSFRFQYRLLTMIAWPRAPNQLKKMST